MLAAMVLLSCDGTVYHSFKEVDSRSWSPCDTLSFVYEGSDRHGGENAMNLSVQVRYNADYKYKNLLMRVETMNMTDSALLSVDTLCCRIYDDNGRRLGSTAGTLYQSGSAEVFVNASSDDALLLRLSHIMADSALLGVCDVGVKLSVGE